MIGILLSAGFSRRFGPVDKLLHFLSDGRPIALASAENLIKAIPISIAVIRPENKELAELFLNAGLKFVFCSENDQEMADSLSTAIRFSSCLEAANDGFVIALADMLCIQSATISQVATKLRSGSSIVSLLTTANVAILLGLLLSFVASLKVCVVMKARVLLLNVTQMRFTCCNVMMQEF